MDSIRLSQDGAPIGISHYLYLQSYHISKTSFLPEVGSQVMTFRGCDIVQECPLEARTRERDGDGCDRLSLAWTVPRYRRRPIANIFRLVVSVRKTSMQ